MILVFAVAIGLAAGFLLAILQGEPYQPIELKYTWLVLVAALPQFMAFSFSATRERIPDQWIPILLISTQILLLVFVWVNRHNPSMWVLGAGLALNLIVIILNGGWMPISPETLTKLGLPESAWQVGSRSGYSKDLVILRENTTLWFLSDFLTLPRWIPYRVAYSVGDVLIAAGVIGFLSQNDRSADRSKKNDQQEK